MTLNTYTLCKVLNCSSVAEHFTMEGFPICSKHAIDYLLNQIQLQKVKSIEKTEGK